MLQLTLCNINFRVKYYLCMTFFTFMYLITIFLLNQIDELTFFSIKNSHILWDFSCKFIKKICKKRLFSTIFLTIFWQVIPSWVIISYKIIKFVTISYKICCEKCFIQNILQKNWQQFPAIFL